MSAPIVGSKIRWINAESEGEGWYIVGDTGVVESLAKGGRFFRVIWDRDDTKSIEDASYEDEDWEVISDASERCWFCNGEDDLGYACERHARVISEEAS